MKKELSNVWIGQQDLEKAPEFIDAANQEFNDTSLIENLDNEAVSSVLGGNRRDFLKFLGFGLGAATVAAGCDIPVKRAIPYVVKPDEIVPGVANYYASSYFNGGDYLPILVKTREGRPIKIEGNDLSDLTKGGTSARAQAFVLDLYNTDRFRSPQRNTGDGFESISWEDLDNEVMSKLTAGASIRILTNTILSPTAKKALEEFTTKYPNAKVVTYDPVSSAAILDANESSFGDRVIPNYKFDQVEVIVSFNADFLGTWISPVEYANAYIQNRVIKDTKNPKMSRHIQVESHMSLTGSNADNRILVKPSEQGAAIAYLCNEIVGGAGNPNLNENAKRALSGVAKELKAARGKSLVISASNNPAEQVLVNAINHALGNIGSTIDFSEASLQRQGSEKELSELVSEMQGGSVDILIINGANPVYDSAEAAGFEEGMSKVATKISLGGVTDETTALCDLVAPSNHLLESWSDAEPKRGNYSLVQPTISPLFTTRQWELSMLHWASSETIDKTSDQPYFEYLKKHWEAEMFSRQTDFATFQSFWDYNLQRGVWKAPAIENVVPVFSGSVADAASNISSGSGSDLEISFYESVGLGNGQFATNPWLQEMPDPVTRTTWGNYLAVPVDFDGVKRINGMNGLKDGDLVEVTVGGKTMTVPVIQQFGQMKGTVALSLGYGRSNAGVGGTNVGVNVNDCLTVEDGYNHYMNTNVSISDKTGVEEHYSCVQYHHTYGVKGTDTATGETINADEAALAYAYGAAGYQGALTDRSVMYSSNVKDLDESIAHLKEKRAHAQYLNKKQIYGGFDELYETGHHWGMHIDLNACIGCGACTVACMSENNVPVVGKKEVSRHHEMTWLRIDRYYYGNIDNPNVVYQPMMCQHCDNAPCENVCPVNATNHSSEGLNQMTYNRCVGTRYCANNCPYKVRRFNWLDYTTADIFPANQATVNGEEIPYGADNLTRMVLNPDVTVRSRGVIEKCSFCIQRIQEGKLTAKREGRRLRDADVKSACQTACPTGAITFGDFNNKGGDLNEKLESPLNFISLEEVNVRSSVNYTMRVNNRDESLDA